MLYSSKLEEFAEDNFKFDENGRKFFRWVENTGKRRNCSLQAISLFSSTFKILLLQTCKKPGIVLERVKPFL